MVLAHDIRAGIRTKDVKITQDVTFETMLLSPKTLGGLKAAGFHKPSPIQLHGIPLGKCGFDLLLEAKSGTGKTAVFSVITLEKLDLKKGLQVVMLAPTREIAAQICDVLKDIGSQYSGLCVEVVMGGLPVQEDIAKFKNKRKVHVVVGSPGRLRHLMKDNFIDTSSVRLLVLDEADKLMEKSFQADINYIFSSLPKQKQIIMSSATFPEETKTFIDQYVQNSQHVCPETTNILLGIEQKVTVVKSHSNIVNQTKYRYEELLKILTSNQFKQCLVFCNYQARVVELHKMLSRDKWPSEQLYGHQEQTDRLDALKTLQEYRCRILISTDLAARGIDASNVDLVINFEPPYDWQTYLHRIGRAGRFGSFGISITILSQGAEEIKFKKTLFAMKDSLNICYLWTNSKLNFDGFESPKTEPEGMEVNKITENCISDTKPDLQQIWDELNDSESFINELESFEDLNKSFENTHMSKNETFSDLMHSYENSSSEVMQDVPYAHIKVSKKSINQYSNYLNTQTENPNSEILFKTQQIIVPCLKESNGTDNNADTIEIIKEESNPGLYHNDAMTEKKIKESHIEIMPDHNNIDKKGTSNINSESNKTSVNDLEKEMSRLGLPTAFGKNWKNSSENIVTGENTEGNEVAQYRAKGKQRRHRKQRKDRNITENRQAHGLNYGSCAEVDESNAEAISWGKSKKQFSHSSKIPKQYFYNEFETSEKQSPKSMKSYKQYYQNVSENSDDEQVDSNSSSWEKSKKHYSHSSGPPKQDYYNEFETYEKQSPKPKKSQKQYHKTRISESSDDEEAVSTSSKGRKYERYMQWYNQIKARTRQLELAFYIQEMSI